MAIHPGASPRPPFPKVPKSEGEGAGEGGGREVADSASKSYFPPELRWVSAEECRLWRLTYLRIEFQSLNLYVKFPYQRSLGQIRVEIGLFVRLMSGHKTVECKFWEDGETWDFFFLCRNGVVKYCLLLLGFSPVWMFCLGVWIGWSLGLYRASRCYF